MHSTPKIRNGVLTYWEYMPIGKFTHTIAMDSNDFRVWLTRHESFRIDLGRITFTVRAERKKRGGFYWYAYKRVNGRLFKRYLGTDEMITETHLRSILWEES
jgi:LuxR family maltose regulon positive regulatory protein